MLLQGVGNVTITVVCSGVDRSDGCIVESPGDDVTRISGLAILDNHAVNLISSLLTSIVMSRVVFSLSVLTYDALKTVRV